MKRKNGLYNRNHAKPHVKFKNFNPSKDTRFILNIQPPEAGSSEDIDKANIRPPAVREAHAGDYDKDANSVINDVQVCNFATLTNNHFPTLSVIFYTTVRTQD